MVRLPLQISSMPSFRPQVSKIERTVLISSFSDSGSCTVDCPISGRNLTRNAARFRLNAVAALDQRSLGHLPNYYIPESRVFRGVLKPESTRVLSGGLSRHLRVSLERQVR